MYTRCILGVVTPNLLLFCLIVLWLSCDKTCREIKSLLISVLYLLSISCCLLFSGGYIFHVFSSLIFRVFAVCDTHLSGMKIRMTQTARMSRASSQEDEYVFCWKVFTGLFASLELHRLLFCSREFYIHALCLWFFDILLSETLFFSSPQAGITWLETARLLTIKLLLLSWVWRKWFWKKKNERKRNKETGNWLLFEFWQIFCKMFGMFNDASHNEVYRYFH